MEATETDAALLAKVHAGDARAVAALLEKHQRQVYRYGLRMCGNEADARDVLQETLLAAYRNLGAFRGDARLSTWLFQIARSFCLRQRRRREGEPARHATLEGAAERLASDVSASDARAHARQVSEVIQAAIATLPAEHREALLLRDVEGLSADEAAAVAGVEVGALKSRLHRARVALKAQLSAVLDADAGAIECPELADELAAYAASEIDQAACERIEEHLARCARCAVACESLKRTVSMCRALPGGDVPAPVKAAVRAALRGAGLDVPP
ncbi:MAG: sigma-70 family RNA polymerase sigma factor [Myxococcaceae bacterium]|jgi:RNA polymerase sigma-70 factor (ECF subfamily)|nr:sigma-70 family RNA polymerase sigma factor [Myxococcaceae bacterium]MCA3012470.1 sigma-70 family RNA polymerase sigma factor [Myxococcaceae bacterium]